MRIGFDVDGVFADMDRELVRQSDLLFGSGTRTGQADAGEDPAGDAAEGVPELAKLKLTARQQKTLWRQVRSIENFWETLAEIEPGAAARLAALALQHRWEVIFLTRRPSSAGATAQLQTQRWFAARGFPLPSVFVASGPRGAIASALGLDVVIDDRPENCLDVVAASTARAILVWRDREELVPPAIRNIGIAIVPSVAACFDALVSASAHGGERTGIAQRVMRLFGRA